VAAVSARGLAALAGAALLVAGPPAARAGGFALPDQSVVAAGSGGASTARDDDAGAAWYNPAALIDGGGLRTGFGLVAASSALEARDPAGAWSAESSGTAPLPQLHLAWSHGQLGAALYVGVPFGGAVRWPADWAGRHELIASRLEVLRVAPAIGYRLGRLRLAGGLHLDVGHLAVERSLDFIDHEGDVAIDLRGAGVGLDLAAWLELEPVAVGLSYKSRTRLALSGEADFDAPDAFGGALPDQGARSSITLPDRLALGARWRRGALAVLGDLELTAWGTSRALVISFDDPATPDATQRQDWHATVALRAGAEWRTARFTARAGGAIDPSPTDPEHMTPSSPGATRLSAALGGSYALAPRLLLDASFSHLRLLGATATGESLMATYRGTVNFVGLAVRWQPAP
jgi:long-chain fatty acid transport protein